MKILITGGTGFVGSCLTNTLLQRGDEITVIGSSSAKNLESGSNLHFIQADTSKEGEWQNSVGGQDVIVNLTGRTIFNLWSASYKEKIYSSRVDTTRNIVTALPQETDIILLNTSAAGFYGDSGENERDESCPPGNDFLAEVCQDWEKEARAAEEKGARVAIMRFGVVLGKQGGAIATMKTPFKLGMGGSIGSGKQWFPWIHVDDLVAAILFLIDSSDLSGVFNFTAPDSVRQKEFARALGRAVNRPTFMPTPAFVMKSLLGEFGQTLLMGQKVIPKALQERGFVFKYPQLKDALQEILHG